MPLFNRVIGFYCGCVNAESLFYWNVLFWNLTLAHKTPLDKHLQLTLGNHYWPPLVTVAAMRPWYRHCTVCACTCVYVCVCVCECVCVWVWWCFSKSFPIFCVLQVDGGDKKKKEPLPSQDETSEFIKVHSKIKRSHVESWQMTPSLCTACTFYLLYISVLSFKLVWSIYVMSYHRLRLLCPLVSFYITM